MLLYVVYRRGNRKYIDRLRRRFWYLFLLFTLCAHLQKFGVYLKHLENAIVRVGTWKTPFIGKHRS
jgi:hypothetical protein